MKKDIAEKWVAALRSGKYKQTTGDLQNKNGFCCLGVLCDVMEFPFDVNFKSDGQFNILGHNVRQATGVSTAGGDLIGMNSSLWQLNDLGFYNEEKEFVKSRLTFDEIADIIQICYKEL